MSTATNQTNPFSPPSDNQIEVSVFGPGYGESILIHLGNRKWLAIDSCVDGTKKCVPLDYLEKLGFNPKEDVAFIIASHWHDDHVKGLHQLVQACEKAIFSCSSVLTKKEFTSLADLYSQSNAKVSVGPRELYNCISTIKARIASTEKRNLLRWSLTDRVLFESKNRIPIKLTTLSPSDAMLTRSLNFLTSYVSALSKGLRDSSVTPQSPNDVAVAMLLEINGRNILLGSDLEEDKDVLYGWAAVVDSQAMQNINKCSTFKTAHHGSKSGHNDHIWTNSLEHDHLSLITPFRHAHHRLPNSEDRKRILSLTQNAYITAHPDIKYAAPKLTSNKNQALRNSTPKSPLNLAIGQVGHIRWRASIDNPSDKGVVDCFNGAMHLRDI